MELLGNVAHFQEGGAQMIIKLVHRLFVCSLVQTRGVGAYLLIAYTILLLFLGPLLLLVRQICFEFV